MQHAKNPIPTEAHNQASLQKFLEHMSPIRAYEVLEELFFDYITTDQYSSKNVVEKEDTVYVIRSISELFRTVKSDCHE